MNKKAYRNNLKERLDKLTHEVVQLKSILIYQTKPNKIKVKAAWADLMKASEEVSNLWSGCSALEEIRSQRETN